MPKDTVVVRLASAVGARNNCELHGHTEWARIWRDYIELVAKDYLPRGSGVDKGTQVVLDRSNSESLVFSMDYHPMDAHGYYKAWEHHVISVRPSFSASGFTFLGRHRSETKQYLLDLLHTALCREIPEETQKQLLTKVRGE